MTKKLLVLILALSLLSLPACSMVPGVGSATSPSSSTELEYTFVTGVNLAKEESVPGGAVTFLSSDDQGIHLTVQGQAATKHIGDSLSWQMSPASEVTADYELRLLGVILDHLQATGTVKVTVLNPHPQAAPLPGNPTLRYDNAPVTYDVQRGEAIPGTSWSFADFDQNQGAKLGGVEGLPYRKVGDSIDWSGGLTEKTYLNLSLRVLSADKDTLRLVGTASLLLQ